MYQKLVCQKRKVRKKKEQKLNQYYIQNEKNLACARFFSLDPVIPAFAGMTADWCFSDLWFYGNIRKIMRRIFYCFGMVVLFLCTIPTSVIKAAPSQAELQAQLDQIEKEKAEVQKNLDVTKTQTTSIQKDVNVLTGQINKTKLDIKAKDINIKQIGSDIVVKTQRIGDLNGQIQRGQESLTQIIKKLNEIDEITLPEIVFANDTLSGALIDIDSFNTINRSLEDLFANIRGVKTETEKEKEALDPKKNSELDAKQAIEAAKRAVEKKESEKKQLLSLSKQKEVSYAQVLLEKEKKAQKIRDALFELRDSNGVPFGTALSYAKDIQKSTGVRPAFLLAILTQETNLGKNLGSCYLADPATGSGVRVSTGASVSNVMKPSRDVQPFLEITKELGRDPYKTLVSCPIASVGGYGGAMGPAQFIPSTWDVMKDKVASILGVSTPDPWKARDAFTASALYLSDRGAGGGSYSAEMNAACKYYSGRACSETSSGRAYGNQVMAKATNIQENMIDVLENN